MTEIARGILDGHFKRSSNAQIIAMVEDGIRLALGPGRLAFVEVFAPERPEWLP